MKSIEIIGVLNAVEYAKSIGYHGVLIKKDGTENTYLFPASEDYIPTPSQDQEVDMTAIVNTESGVICGKCRKEGKDPYYHASVADVKKCYRGTVAEKSVRYFNTKDGGTMAMANEFASSIAQMDGVSNVKASPTKTGNFAVTWSTK